MESGSVLLAKAQSNDTLLVNSFQTSISKRDSLENHSSIISMGATLNTKPNQPAGVYSSKGFNVIVNFE